MELLLKQETDMYRFFPFIWILKFKGLSVQGLTVLRLYETNRFYEKREGYKGYKLHADLNYTHISVFHLSVQDGGLG